MVVSTISEEEFAKEITEFVRISKGDVWTLHKRPSGIIAKQSSICRFDDHPVINRQSHFIYNKKLSRVELWFMFYARNGRPIRISEIAEILGTKPESNDAIVIELSTHPTLQIPFYKLYENPDDDSDHFQFIDTSDNYISRWISAFGAEAGLAPKKSQSEGSCAQSTVSSSDD
ncbi:unnamed protein product [Caenorhabditis angaria]|uniref:Uncharacterized protein n=1 Tax=Caenorhabditis angaria TaxID=860376 RepID=A0A9P1MUY5_9PELO|nr:unnamed protein product [Caenorhabditis angaria]